MLSFHDQLSKDFDEVFFNENEFAEQLIVDGKSIVVIKDDDLLKKFNFQREEGLTEGELLFVVKKKDFEDAPFVTKIMRHKNRAYRIINLLEDDFTYTITLAGHRS